MRQFLKRETLEMTETVWQGMLELDIHPRTLPAVLEPSEGFLTGRVEISGTWNGVVLLHGSAQLAHSAALKFFGNGDADVTQQDLMDAMYELTHIIGGNIKSFLSGTCQLSLPCVYGTTPEILSVSDAEQVSDLVFDCQEQPLFVSVWKRQDQ